MELAVIGVVTAEGIARLWTRHGCRDLWVEESDRLRNSLGLGALERAPMALNAELEMVLFDEDEDELYVVAPFDAGERPRLLTKPVAFAWLSAVHGEGWSTDTAESLDQWLASRVVTAASRGEDLIVFERDADEQGSRVVSVACVLDDDGDWVWHVATNDAPPDYAIWNEVRDRSGGGVITSPYAAARPDQVSALVMTVVMAWPGGPRDLVVGYDRNQDGINPHALSLVPRRAGGV